MKNWQFIDLNGSFTLENPHQTNYLYFPLVNEAGMMSSITPLLNGDAKTSQNTFLLSPVSVEDLHNTRSARNFWLTFENGHFWSATGNSVLQSTSSEQLRMEAGFLWHRVIRENSELGIRAEITSFVPPDEYQVELMQVTLTNTNDQPLTFTPTAAIPIYGRSADNLRDHRHVTSLLHRIVTQKYGVLVRPTLSFDERGHLPNKITYGVLGIEADGTAPINFIPVIEDFIGEGGNLENPVAVKQSLPEGYPPGTAFDGYEAIGALRFDQVALQPGESKTYLLMLVVLPENTEAQEIIEYYGNQAKFDAALQRTCNYWHARANAVTFQTSDENFDRWMKWITIQPVLRRLFGNSFLPYHDYGRGGRGWRDLWQDCLALLLTEPDEVHDLLFSSFGGIRMDGSNATIIGTKRGEFIADRNNIPRVWMDHGAWPFLTTKLYLDQSGDLGFLLEKQRYFKDPQIKRCKAQDKQWKSEQGTSLLTTTGEPYEGTILEHLLVQHLTVFFNVGEHNILKLEGADWNDGLDMACQRGESVAFTALYAGNLRELSQLALALEQTGVQEVQLYAGLALLLDALGQHPLDYNDIEAKHLLLEAYFETCEHRISGRKFTVSLRDLSRDLARKAHWIINHLQQQEWITDKDSFSWFNGYYDDDGMRVEGDHPKGTRMTLTGQVFTLMGGIATDEQAHSIVQAVNQYLWDDHVGYRLNTNFDDVLLNLGRCFGFAFGHKENGAMFSHMAVMYANALYQRGLYREGHRVLDQIFQHCIDFETSRMYPGIPEYLSARGRGMYSYLTGSASWLLLTMVTEVFGVKGHRGNLVLDPKLMCEQFNGKQSAAIRVQFAGKPFTVIYRNPSLLDPDQYQVQGGILDGKAVEYQNSSGYATLPRAIIAALGEGEHQLEVSLGARS